MDLIEGMRAFVAVVEAGSFTEAGARTGISNKVVSKYVAELEGRLGLRLLNRTTRTSSLTEAGSRYYTGCVELLSGLDTLEGGLRDDEVGLRGTLRVTAPVAFGEMRLVPLLATFGDAHPELVIDMQLDDRYVDITNEGFDVAVRIGKLTDSGLVARRLAAVDVWAVASPDYLARCGTPRTPDELKGHRCVRDTNLRSGGAWPYIVDGARRPIRVDGQILVNSTRSVRDLVLADRGIGLCPDYVVAEAVREKRLMRLLSRYEGPMLEAYAVYASGRNLAPKVRACVDFLVQATDGNRAGS